MAFVPTTPAVLRSSTLRGTPLCTTSPASARRPAPARGHHTVRAAADGGQKAAAGRRSGGGGGGGGGGSRKARAIDAPTFVKDLKGRTLWSIRRATADDVGDMARLAGGAALPAALLGSLVEGKSRVCLVAEAPIVVGGGTGTGSSASGAGAAAGGVNKAIARPTERVVAAAPAAAAEAATAEGDAAADADAKTVSSGVKGGSSSSVRIVAAAVCDVSASVRPGGGGLTKVGNLIGVHVDERMEAAAGSDGAASVSVKKVMGLAALRAMKLAGVESVSAEKKVDSPEVAYLTSLGYTEGEKTSKDGKRLVSMTCNLVAASPDPGKKIFD